MSQQVFSQLAVVVAVTTAMVAAGLLVAAPPRGPDRRSDPGSDRSSDPSRQRWAARAADLWSRLLRGRPDRISDRMRTVLAAAAGLAATTTTQAMGLPATAAWALAVLVALAGWLGSGWFEDPATRRRRDRVTAELPTTCDLLAACLVAGLPLRRAVVVVAEAVRGPVAEDLQRVAALVATGEHEAAAWRSLGSGSPPWRRLALDLARSVESGTAVAETLHEHARLSREVAEAAQERRARTAGVRSVLPLMVCFLPAFFLIGVVPIVAGLLLHLVG